MPRPQCWWWIIKRTCEAAAFGRNLCLCLFLPLVLVTGCADISSSDSGYDAISRYLTPALIDQHLRSGTEPSPHPTLRVTNGQLLADFDGRCLITIGRGNSFFTDADYQRARAGFFASVLGDSLSPRIGRRAFIAGIEQDAALFTTTDGRYDVRIEPRGTPQPVEVVGVAAELSDLYDGHRHHPFSRGKGD
jgi:hypothetical protein